MSKLNRRDFLKGLAASVGVAAVAPFVSMPETKKEESQLVSPAVEYGGSDPYMFFWPPSMRLPDIPKYDGPVYFEGLDKYINTAYREDDSD